ncbi:MAG: hypothetical protein JXR91_10645 [Deltaproteobacteria bacterium]|nr:hypothetical protein [Deltaproteobacteria bacterium]
MRRDSGTWKMEKIEKRTGTVPPPPPSIDQPKFAEEHNYRDTLELSETEMQTVLTTFAPPPEKQKNSKVKNYFINGVFAIAAALITWIGLNVYSYYNDDNSTLKLMAAANSSEPTVITIKTDKDESSEIADKSIITPVIDMEFTENDLENSGSLVEKAVKKDSSSKKEDDIKVDESKSGEETAINPDNIIISEKKVEPVEELSPEAKSAMDNLNSLIGRNDVPSKELMDELLPRIPSKDDIDGALNSIAQLTKRCGVSQSGRVVIKLIIEGNTGHVVSSSAIDDQFKLKFPERFP